MAARERAFALFRSAGDVVQAASAAIFLCLDYDKQLGDAAAAGGWLDQAARLVDDNHLDGLRGWLAFARAFHQHDPVESEAVARAAHEIGVASGDRDLELCALSQIGVALVGQGRVADGVRCLDEALAVSLGAGEPATVVFTSCMMMTSCTRCAEFARAAQWVRATTAFSERYGCPFLYAECRILYGEVLVATGEWRQAESELAVGLEMTRGAVPALHRLAVAGLARLWLLQGRLEEAERLLGGQGEHAETAPAVALAHLLRGEAAPAAALLRRRLAEAGRDRIGGGVLLDLLGEAELLLGDPDHVARIGRDLAELASTVGCEVLRARGERLLGRALAASADGPGARRHLDAALVAFARLDMRYEVARTRAQLAELLRGTEPEVAVAEGRAALAVFEELGAGADADAAAASLRDLGVKVGRIGPRTSAALTKREAEVLALLGEGLSNPEMAARLHLSRKTVEHHVAAVLSKLGLRGRAEAAAEVVRRMGSGQPGNG